MIGYVLIAQKNSDALLLRGDFSENVHSLSAIILKIRTSQRRGRLCLSGMKSFIFYPAIEGGSS